MMIGRFVYIYLLTDHAIREAYELIILTECFQIELCYHRIEHDIYKRLIEQLHQVYIYDSHELISVVPNNKNRT
jgi:hypothetical protein